MPLPCPPPCPYSTQTPSLCAAMRPVVHDDRAYEGNHFCTACRRSFQADCDQTKEATANA